jgi:predicted nucleic acid-binding protein
VSFMVFVDTSVIIDLMAGDKHVVSLLNNLAEDEEIKTTSMSCSSIRTS